MAQKYQELNIKDKIKIIMAPVSFMCAVIIGFIALFLPPTGAIDASVLWFTAQLLVFVSSLLGISLTLDGFRQFATTDKNSRPRNNKRPIEGELFEEDEMQG